MNRKLLLLVLLLINACVFSQTYEVDFVKYPKNKGDYLPFGIINGNLLGEREYKDKSSIEVLKFPELTGVGVTEFSKTMTDERQNDLIMVARVVVKDRLMFFATHYSRKIGKNCLYGIIFNSHGEILVDWKELAYFETTSLARWETGKFEIKFPNDSSKFVVRIIPFAKFETATTTLLHFKVFDLNMEELWESKQEVPFKPHHTTIKEIGLSINNKCVHVLASIADFYLEKLKPGQEFSTRVPSIHLYTLYADKNEMTDYKIEMDKNTLIASKFYIGSNNSVHAVGYYGEQTGKNLLLTGYFYIRFNKTFDGVEIHKTNKVNPELIKSLNKTHIEDEPRFVIKQIFEKPDSGIIVLGEQQGIVENSDEHRTYRWETFNSIVYTNFDKEGNTLQQQIIQKKSGYSGLGHYAMLLNDKLHIFFNDDKRNFANGIPKTGVPEKVFAPEGCLVDAVVESNGKVTYHVVIDNEINKLYFDPNRFMRLSENSFYIIGDENAGIVTIH